LSVHLVPTLSEIHIANIPLL